MSGDSDGEITDGNRVVFMLESKIKHNIYYTAAILILRTRFSST